MTDGASVRVAAVVAAFNPDLDALRHNLEVIARQADDVVVVDDGSREPITASDLPAGVRLLRQDNAGIARALNAGVAAVRSLHHAATWPTAIATFDQDSTPSDTLIRSSLDAIDVARAAGVDVGASCASTLGGRATHVHQMVAGVATALQIAQSGMVYPPGAFDRIGPFDERLFIDAVDTDHALRMLGAGARVIIAPGTSLEHAVGDVRTATVLGRPIRLPGRTIRYAHHSGERRYYITRNRIALLRRYRRTALGWMLYDDAVEARTLMLCLVFGPRRWEQLRGTLLGFRDGVRGRLGRISDATRRRVVGRP